MNDLLEPIESTKPATKEKKMAKIDVSKYSVEELAVFMEEAKARIAEEAKEETIKIIAEMLKGCTPDVVNNIKGVLTGEFKIVPNGSTKPKEKPEGKRSRSPNKGKPDYTVLSFNADAILPKLKEIGKAVPSSDLLILCSLQDDRELAKELIKETLHSLIEAGKVLKIGERRATTYKAI